MNKFERYLIADGMQIDIAGRYGRIVDNYINWLTTQGLKPKQVKKRSQLMEFFKHCYSIGNKKRTVVIKETAIKRYYEFLGTKFNPAHTWRKRRKKHTLPAKALERDELNSIYDSINPRTPAGYRDRCILGLIVYQGVMRQDVAELRLSDLDLEIGEVTIIGKRKTNSRKLKLEYKQAMHLYEYINKYRKDFLAYKGIDTDRVFMSKGSGNKLNNALSRLLRTIRTEFPQVEDFTHLRTSVITHWEKEDGIIEAKVKAGHRYVSSTERYQTDKYDELQKQLLEFHPMEKLVQI